MNYQNENLRSIFWLRPAYERNSWATKLRSLCKNPTVRITVLLVSFLVLFVSVSVHLDWIDLVHYSTVSKEKAMQLFIRKSTSPPDDDVPFDCVTWRRKKKCPKNYATPYAAPKNNSDVPSSNPTCPDYFRWIHEDLKPWKETGITRDMLEKVGGAAHFRLVILDGKIYVEKFEGHWAPLRVSFTTWGILQLLRFYPGKLPNLELMFDCDDTPAVSSSGYRGPNAGPPALFRYCSDWWNYDIVFPDWTFWGCPDTNVRPWRNILRDIKEGNTKRKWKDRVPYAYWRGNPHVAPWRVDLLTCNLTDKDDWNARLFVQDWNVEKESGYSESNLEDQCTYRYKIYIEGTGWSVSEKYIFACDSQVLKITPRFFNFFSRGLMPQRHYWPVKDNDKCRSLKFAVDYGNKHANKAEAIGAAGSRFVHEEMTMEYVYDYMFHLLSEYAKLLKFEPAIPPNAVEMCAESMACPADEINWRKFMAESLEKSPSENIPCTLPPPYEIEALKAFNDQKFVLTKQVEMREKEYWEKQTN